MVKEAVREIRKVAIFRALQLGDLLVAVPALRAIRAGLPSARITLIGLPWARLMLERYPHYLDDFIEFPGFPGLPEVTPDLRRLPGFLAEVQRENFHLAVQMHGSGVITNPLVASFDAALTAGYFLPGAYCPEPALFLPYNQTEHEIDRCADLIRNLGFPVDDERLEFPIYQRDMDAFRQLAQRFNLPVDAVVVIHGGASVDERRWQAKKFARLADRLIEDGYTVALTGSADEHPVVERIVQRMQQRAVNLCGETDLGMLAALLSASRLVICNDTGVSHLADAVNAASVVLFSASDPRRWAPKNSRLHVALENAASLGADEVYQAATQLLAAEASRQSEAQPHNGGL